MIRGIIFDCFGVLYGGSRSALLNLCPADKINEFYDLSKQSDHGYIDRTEYINGVASLTGKDPEFISDLLHTKHVRNVALANFAAMLRPEYKVALLSNVGSETIESLFTSDELSKLFDTIVLSNQEGITKPNPVIFSLTAERLGLRPEECVMIDDLESNCDGAEVAGMQSILHTTNDNTRYLLSKILKENP